jgi:hypothetical protein
MTACGHLGRSQWKSGSGRPYAYPSVRFPVRPEQRPKSCSRLRTLYGENRPVPDIRCPPAVAGLFSNASHCPLWICVQARFICLT